MNDCEKLVPGGLYLYVPRWPDDIGMLWKVSSTESSERVGDLYRQIMHDYIDEGEIFVNLGEYQSPSGFPAGVVNVVLIRDCVYLLLLSRASLKILE